MTPVTPDSSPSENRHTVTFNMESGVVTIPTLLIDDDDDEVEEENCCWNATRSGCSLACTYATALLYGMVNAIILPFHFMLALIVRIIFCPYLFLIVLLLSISFIYILPRNPSSSSFFFSALLYSLREVPYRMPPVPRSTGTPSGSTKMTYWSSAMLYGLALKLSLIAFCLFKHKLTKLYRYLTKKREVTIEDVEMQSISNRVSTPLPPRRVKGRGGRPVLLTSSVDRRPRTPIVRKSRGPARPQLTQSVPGSFEL